MNIDISLLCLPVIQKHVIIPSALLFFWLYITALNCQISFRASQLGPLIITARTHTLPVSVLSEPDSLSVSSWLGDDVTLYQITHKSVCISRDLMPNYFASIWAPSRLPQLCLLPYIKCRSTMFSNLKALFLTQNCSKPRCFLDSLILWQPFKPICNRYFFNIDLKDSLRYV